MKSSFTIIELIIVVIIIGILAFSINFKFFNPDLQAAADQVIKDIRYTQSLALKDDKYQPFPANSSSIEQNRSKYWFKQWWQIRFTKDKNSPYNLWYEIFSDQPINNSYNFDKVGNYPPKQDYWNIGYAKDPLTNKYMVGKCDDEGNYPSCNQYNSDLNLSKYGIVNIMYDIGDGFKNVSSNNSLRLLFDNVGNVFVKEGDKGDAGDINPLDKDKRPLLTTTAKIQLCLDNPCIQNKYRCIQINITPIGGVYKSKCN